MKKYPALERQFPEFAQAARDYLAVLSTTVSLLEKTVGEKYKKDNK